MKKTKLDLSYLKDYKLDVEKAFQEINDELEKLHKACNTECTVLYLYWLTCAFTNYWLKVRPTNDWRDFRKKQLKELLMINPRVCVGCRYYGPKKHIKIIEIFGMLGLREGSYPFLTLKTLDLKEGSYSTSIVSNDMSWINKPYHEMSMAELDILGRLGHF